MSMSRGEKWVEFWSLLGIIGIGAFVMWTLMPHRARGQETVQPACITMEVEEDNAKLFGARLLQTMVGTDDTSAFGLQIYAHEAHFDVSFFYDHCAIGRWINLDMSDVTAIIAKAFGRPL